MKYIKYFESIKTEPQIGDYVVLLDMYNPPKEKDVIGVITKIDDVEQTEEFKDAKTGLVWNIKKFYTVIELSDSNTEHSLEIDEIDFFSPNIDECKMFINTSKYNL